MTPKDHLINVTISRHSKIEGCNKTTRNSHCGIQIYLCFQIIRSYNTNWPLLRDIFALSHLQFIYSFKLLRNFFSTVFNIIHFLCHSIIFLLLCETVRIWSIDFDYSQYNHKYKNDNAYTAVSVAFIIYYSPYHLTII